LPVCHHRRPFPYPKASRRAAGSPGRRCPQMRNPPHGPRGCLVVALPSLFCSAG
jgi:hypothetical protein